MAVDIKKLCAQLRKQVPAVANSPILDEIESGYADEEKSEGDGAPVEGEPADGQPDDGDLGDEAADPEDQADGGADEAAEGEDDYGLPPPKAKPKAPKGQPAGKRPMPKMSKSNPFM